MAVEVTALNGRDEIAQELQRTIDKESRIDAELAALFQTRSGSSQAADANIRRKLEALDKATPELKQLCTEADSLAKAMGESKEMSDQVSATLRVLNTAQVNVAETLSRAENVLNLKGCIEGVQETLRKGDFEASAKFVSNFKEVEKLISVEGEDYRVMVKAEKDLEAAISAHFDKAINANDSQAIVRCCNIYKKLDKAQEGLERYMAYLGTLLQQTAAQASADKSKSSYIDLLQAVFNRAANLVQVNEQLLMQLFLEVDGPTQLVSSVHMHCEKIACGILAKYVKHRSLQQRPELQQQELDDEAVLGVDELLDEVALVIQHAVNYDRFSLAKAQDAIASMEAAKKNAKKSGRADPKDARSVIGGSNSSLSKLVVLLSRSYAELETLFARNSMTKAIRIDEVFDGSQVSNAVEDCFYIARKCGNRAMATGTASSCVMVMNDVNSELSEQLLAVLHDRVKGMKLANSSYFGTMGNLANANLGQAQAAATAMQSAALMGVTLGRSPAKPPPGEEATQDEQQSVTSPPVTLNNLETSSDYASQLHQEFERDVAEVFQNQIGTEGGAPPASDPALYRKLRAAVADMAKLSTKSKSVLDAGVVKLSSLLKPRLLSLTDKLVGEQSEVIFELSEEDFAENEVRSEKKE
jgi:hypothetical protein